MDAGPAVDGLLAGWIRVPPLARKIGTRAAAINRVELFKRIVRADLDGTWQDAFIATINALRIVDRGDIPASQMRGGWAGVLTNSPDGHIILEETPGYDGLFLALGDSGTNFKTAPMIGKCLAEWIVDGAPKTVDIPVFRGGRFESGEPIPGGVAYGVGPTSVFH